MKSRCRVRLIRQFVFYPRAMFKLQAPVTGTFLHIYSNGQPMLILFSRPVFVFKAWKLTCKTLYSMPGESQVELCTNGQVNDL